MEGQSDQLKYKLVYWGGQFAGRGEPIRMLLGVTGEKWEDSIRGTDYSGKPR